MRSSTVILGVLVVALGATSLWQWRALQAERSRVAELQAELARIPDDGRATLASAKHKRVPASEVAAETGTSESQAGSAPVAVAFDPQLLTSNKEYRALMQRLNELSMAAMYADLAQALGISQEKADQVVAILVDGQLRMEGTAPQEPPTDAEERRAWRLRMEQFQYETDAEIAAAIGSSRMPEWKKYSETQDARHKVRDLRGELVYTAEPLRADQIEPLVKAFYEEELRVAQEMSPMAQEMRDARASAEAKLRFEAHAAQVNADSQKRIEAAAERILSKAQLKTMTDMHERERETSELFGEMMRINREAGFNDEAD